MHEPDDVHFPLPCQKKDPLPAPPRTVPPADKDNLIDLSVIAYVSNVTSRMKKKTYPTPKTPVPAMTFFSHFDSLATDDEDIPQHTAAQKRYRLPVAHFTFPRTLSISPTSPQ